MSTRSARTEQFLTRVGKRIRARRQVRGWTVQQLADASELSRRMLTQIELGDANPSLATIDRIAHALDTSFGELAISNAQTDRVFNGSTLAWEDEHGSSAHILGATAKADTELWRWHLAPESHYVAEPDRQGSEEIHHVLEGILKIDLEDESLKISAGMTATIRSDQHYSYRATGDTPVEFIRVVVNA